ncbi:MAG: Ig-like domain-containing protein, partial [Chloroflexota bacterium]
SWTAGAAEPAVRSVVATNGGSLTSSDTITLAGDSAAPTGHSIALTGANAPYYGSASVSFSLGNGNDGSGSGLDVASRTVTRETGTLSGDACTGFVADSGTFSSPDTAVSTGHCYRYSFTIGDKVANVSSAAVAVAKVDLTAPSASVTAPTALTGGGNQYYEAGTKTLFFRSTGAGSFSLHANASDADSAVDGVTFPDLSGLGGWSGSTGGTDTTNPYTSPTGYAWTSGAAEPGARTITAADKAANSASDTITIADDISAPTGQSITLTGSGAPYYGGNSVTFATGDGSDTTGGAGLDAASATVTRETGTLSGDSCSSFSADAGAIGSPDTAVSTGHCYRYTFTIKDNVGNSSTAVTATAKVDTDNPTVSLDDPGTPLAGTVALGATASDPSTEVQQVVFERAPAGGSTWTLIGTDTTSPYSASWNTTAVGDGNYDIRAVATDTTNNTSTSLVTSRRVDNTAPQTTIGSTPSDPSNDTAPSFSFNSSEAGSTFECRIDSGSWASCTNPHTLSPALGAGSHTFDVRATDPADNTDGTPATYTWAIDLTAPNTIIGSTPTNPSNDTAPSFSFSSSEAGSTFECRVDTGSWCSCTSPYTLSPALGAGSHTFDVRASDPAGNTDASPASHTWTIDLTAPNTTIG